MSETKKCIISRYDETITTPPFLTIKIDEFETIRPNPEYDEGGVHFASILRSKCLEKGYIMKFYSSSEDDDDFDFDVVVY